MIPVAAAATAIQANGVMVGGIMPFVRTPLPNGVDDSGLLVAQTPLTRGQVGQIVAGIDRRAGAEGVTHGMIALHRRSYYPYVMARGTKEHPTLRHRSPVAIHPDRPQDLIWGEGEDATLTTSFTGQIVPASEVYVGPQFANHPAVNITWYHSASLAAALTDMDGQYVVRLMTSGEFDRLVFCDNTITDEEVIRMAHLQRDGVEGTASVIGDAAEGRTNRWGLVDMFGNVCVWTLDLCDPAEMQKRGVPIRITRVLRGASWNDDPQGARVAGRVRGDSAYYVGCGGARFVAVPRTP